MKKYIKPISMLVNLENENILAGSGSLNNGDGVGRHTVGGGADNNFAKGFNGDDWDDDNY